MKWFISCALFFVINISKDINAINDSNPIDFGDGNFKSDTLSCYRPCKLNAKPKRCNYKFRVAPTIINEKEAIAINNNIPGPKINVCLNDIIIVEVHNRIPNQDLFIHWHGIEQIGTPYMDGVPMVTQCPIFYYGIYKYVFRATKAGTFFYYGHSVSQQSDGVFGALIVNQPSPLEPHASLYEHDRSKEHTLLVSAIFENLFTGNLNDMSEVKPIALQINGDEHYKIFMMEGIGYRLRFINAIAIDCPIIVSIDDHDITIIASDSDFVKPVTVKKVILYPGERMDVIVKANQQINGYKLHVKGGGICKGIYVRAYIVYSGVNYTSIAPFQRRSNPDNTEKDFIINGQMLQSLKDREEATGEDKNVRSFYLGIDKSIVTETNNDFRYISNAMPKMPFYPVTFDIANVVQINGKSFLYPNAPILTQPQDLIDDTVCEIGSEHKNSELQCLQILKSLPNDIVELALVNEGARSNNSYTFHMHGCSMQVLTTWKNSGSTPINKEEFSRLNKEGVLIRNLVNPPLKDTVSVPSKGLVIVRLKMRNPGSWLLECRSCGISSLPTALLINVTQTISKSVLRSFPKCGSYRPPDVLLY